MLGKSAHYRYLNCPPFTPIGASAVLKGLTLILSDAVSLKQKQTKTKVPERRRHVKQDLGITTVHER